MTSCKSRFSDEIIYLGLLNLSFTQNVTANFNLYSNSVSEILSDKFLKKTQRTKLHNTYPNYFVVKNLHLSELITIIILIAINLNRNSFWVYWFSNSFKKWTHTQCSNSPDIYSDVLPFILFCNELIKVLIQIIFHFRRVSKIHTHTPQKSFILVHLSLSIYLQDTFDILIFHCWVNICCQNSHFK